MFCKVAPTMYLDNIKRPLDKFRRFPNVWSLEIKWSNLVPVKSNIGDKLFAPHICAEGLCLIDQNMLHPNARKTQPIKGLPMHPENWEPVMHQRFLRHRALSIRDASHVRCKSVTWVTVEDASQCDAGVTFSLPLVLIGAMATLGLHISRIASLSSSSLAESSLEE